MGTAEHSGCDFAQPPMLKGHDLYYEKSNMDLHFMDWLHGTDGLKRDRPVELKRRIEDARSRDNVFSKTCDSQPG